LVCAIVLLTSVGDELGCGDGDDDAAATVLAILSMWSGLPLAPPRAAPKIFDRLSRELLSTPVPCPSHFYVTVRNDDATPKILSRCGSLLSAE